MAMGLDDVRADALKALRVLERHARHVDGEADADSDIDLAAFIEGADAWDIRERARVVCLVQREAGDHVELHLFPATALTDPEAKPWDGADAMPSPARDLFATSESGLVSGKDAHAALRRRIRMDTSRMGRTEDAAWGERRPLASKSGEKCGLAT